MSAKLTKGQLDDTIIIERNLHQKLTSLLMGIMEIGAESDSLIQQLSPEQYAERIEQEKENPDNRAQQHLAPLKKLLKNIQYEHSKFKSEISKDAKIVKSLGNQVTALERVINVVEKHPEFLFDLDKRNAVIADITAIGDAAREVAGEDKELEKAIFG